MSRDVDPVRLVLWSRSVPDVLFPTPGALSEALRFVERHRLGIPESAWPVFRVPRSTSVPDLVATD